jgi:tetratricopeptide (TPR) repeat protein
MKCAEAEALFVDAGDGRLDLSQEVRLAGHLDGCSGCRERAVVWRRLVPGMRGLAPEAPDAMRVRRMQIEIERRLAPVVRAPHGSRERWVRWSAALVFASAAALAVLWIRRPADKRIAQAETGYGVVAHIDGELTAEGRRLAPDSHLGADSHLALAAGRADLKLGRNAQVRLLGPARLGLEGTAKAIALRLLSGQVDAEVAHREADETFAVITPELRVEVRGTHFTVGAASGKSWVRVDEGRVEVTLASGEHRFVSTGETLASPSPPAPATEASNVGAPSETPVPEENSPPAAPPSPRESPAACLEARRLCETTALAARESMRAGDQGRALRQLGAVAGPLRAAHAKSACGSAGVAACEDELGYLRAEALRGAGQIDGAIAAYQRLGGRAEPAPMRQNALYAAAELEARHGQTARARADYERALAVAPRGALAGESMLGAMDSAAALGDHAHAASLARRYLAAFPAGLGAARARRIAGGQRP